MKAMPGRKARARAPASALISSSLPLVGIFHRSVTNDVQPELLNSASHSDSESVSVAIKDKKFSKIIPGKTAFSGVWIDPLRLPTRLAQRNPLASASLPQVLHRLQSKPGNEVEGKGKNSKYSRAESTALRYWMELGDILLKKE